MRTWPRGPCPMYWEKFRPETQGKDPTFRQRAKVCLADLVARGKFLADQGDNARPPPVEIIVEDQVGVAKVLAQVASIKGA